MCGHVILQVSKAKSNASIVSSSSGGGSSSSGNSALPAEPSFDVNKLGEVERLVVRLSEGVDTQPQVQQGPHDKQQQQQQQQHLSKGNMAELDTLCEKLTGKDCFTLQHFQRNHLGLADNCLKDRGAKYLTMIGWVLLSASLHWLVENTSATPCATLPDCCPWCWPFLSCVQL